MTAPVLYIDIGNSRLKAALRIAGEIRSLAAIDWRRDGEIEAALVLIETADEVPARAVISNVAGDGIRGQLTKILEEKWQLTPEFLQVQRHAAGITTRYEDPSRLGVDRWLAAIAGFHLANSACCVIDAGTAFTADMIDRNGNHLGGLIAPGLGLMIDSLSRGTAQLEVEETTAVDGVATNTEDAISLGCRDALSGLMQRLEVRVSAIMGEEVSWWITGGEASAMIALSSLRKTYVPDLVIKGIDIIVGCET